MKSGFALILLLASCGFASGLAAVSSDVDGIAFSLSTPAPEFSTVELDGSSYTGISIPGAENLAETGLPSVPVYRAWIEIPIGASVDVSVTENRVSTFDVPSTFPVQPGLPPVRKDQQRDSYTLQFDRSVYVEGGSFPSSWVRIVYAGGMRGRNLALVEVMPVRWNPGDRTVSVLSSADISLSFVGGDVAGSFESARRYAANGYEALLSSTLANYGTFGDGTDSPMGGYLIIAHPDFYATAMDAFVTWKMRSGYPVTLVSTNETGSTSDQIKAYILNALQTWPNPPQYVLLVGDSNFIPGCSATTYSGVSDLYYVCLPDGGFIPDAFIGRFSVETVGQCMLMAQRLIDYEQWNYAGPGNWIQSTGWVASNDQYTISEGTHNYCITNYAEPLGYTADKLYPHTYGATAADVTAAWNQGESMMTHSGHGSETGWADMAYGPSDFANLNNEGMYPGVIGHCCVSCNFAYSSQCWGETVSRTPGRGGLWYYGSVTYSYWDEDDVEQKGEYDYFLGQGIPWAKCWMDGGKLALYSHYSGGGMTLYYFETYTLLGDPSSEMWTWQPGGGIPMTMSVSHPASISGTGPVTVTVAGATNDALVCLWKGDEVYERGFTTDGSITLYVAPATAGDILVTVRRHDYKPYLGTITVTGTGVEGGTQPVPLQLSCANPLAASGAVVMNGQGFVTLRVYDLSGRLVASPFAGEIEGSLSVSLGDAHLASGIYFLRLSGGGETCVQRATILR